jgi:hypothetical protein
MSTDKRWSNCEQYSLAPPLAQLDFAAVSRLQLSRTAIQVFLWEPNNCDAGFVIGENDMTFTHNL